jgi:hypothetical protein
MAVTMLESSLDEPSSIRGFKQTNIRKRFNIIQSGKSIILNLSLEGSSKSSIKIYDLKGREILSSNLVDGINRVDINRATGLYFLEVSVNGLSILSKKIVVK